MKEKVLTHLNTELANIKYPIEFLHIVERINCKRGVWSVEIIEAVDSRLNEYKLKRKMK